MNKSILKIFRKIYSKYNPSNFELRNWKIFSNKEYSNELIYNLLMDNEPRMIARFGSTEMLNLVNYYGIKNPARSSIKYIKGETPEWWWVNSYIHQLKNWSGFFPTDYKSVEQFCEIMLSDIKEIDLLGSWLNNEKYFKNSLKNCKRVVLEDLEPFFCTNPWTKALEGKNVLVVHPFSETIVEQYKRRNLIFENNFLPKFNLITVKAVQSLGGICEYESWFDALEHMKNEIDSIEYDICIIGAGSYGLPLAAHVKRQGKKSIHLAGVTQLLFGIIGSRWEEYIVWPYMNLFNEYWVRPDDKDKPQNHNTIEGSCYW
ncbi:hypothetical protein [Flammeovirga sp. OC4]|uniref:hypothetical protein n=1 Tax=Flammeovirga sp. OC4 TaxID=1382345 RepID=UPI0005C44129|nr:hypothetical protein [Flammeovirga sp. OC4]